MVSTTAAILYSDKKGCASEDPVPLLEKKRVEKIKTMANTALASIIHLICPNRSVSLGRDRELAFLTNSTCHGKNRQIHGNNQSADNHP